MEIRTININNDLQLINNGKTESQIRNSDNQFSSLLNNAMNKVNELQLESEQYKKLLATGEVDNLHDITIAAEKADIALQLTLSIRNKVTEAYREIMRMQI